VVLLAFELWSFFLSFSVLLSFLVFFFDISVTSSRLRGIDIFGVSPTKAF
jgi:hypothetical protein